MIISTWLRVCSGISLFQILIFTSTSLSLYTNVQNKIQDEDNLIDIDTKHEAESVVNEETIGEPRWMSSYIFPIFPQFYNLDYNSVWNFLKRSDTIGYFVIRDIISVSK